MFKSQINQFVHSFTQKIVDDDQRQLASENFLGSSCKLLEEARVWPATCDQVCCELTAVYNYLVVNLGCCLCHYQEALLNFKASKTEELVVSVLNRVYESICCKNNTTNEYRGLEERSNDSISQQLSRIVQALENPLFHFKSLYILGRLLLVVAGSCLYSLHLYQDNASVIVALFRDLTRLAGDPVRKEICHFHHGLLLATESPVDSTLDNNSMGKIAVSIEYVMSLYLVTFQHPPTHDFLDTGHQPWKWLYTAMECPGSCPSYEHLVRVIGQCVPFIDLEKDTADSTTCVMLEGSSHMLRDQITLVEGSSKNRPMLLLCRNFKQPYNCVRNHFTRAAFYGCPQLSIQTYRDALSLNSDSFSILYHLCLVYRSMDLPDLELESLNLCVVASPGAVEEKKKRGLDGLPVMDVDELIWSVKPAVAPVSYLGSKVTFAKRCLELKRFSEAAEQYSSLVKLLQQQDTLPQLEEVEKKEKLNIAEILVEAAEVLLITQQYRECLRLCNNIQPSLSANDSLARNSLSLNDTPPNLLSLQSSLSDSQDFGDKSQNDLMSSFVDPFNTGKSKTNKKSSLKGLSCINLQTSFQKSGGSKKRLRSAESDEKSEDGVDVAEGCKDLLEARLVLCKADALVASSGVNNDQAVYCLQQTIDILLHHPLASEQETAPEHNQSLLLQSPVSKRQRISSDGAASSLLGKSGVQQPPSSSSSSSSSLSMWSTLLMDTALRMAKASFERKRFSSVLNSCRLVEQLFPANDEAVYLKTRVQLQRDSLCHKAEVATGWLTKQGFKPLESATYLKKTLEELQLKLHQASSSSKEKWWNICQRDLVELDIQCIHVLIANK